MMPNQENMGLTEFVHRVCSPSVSCPLPDRTTRNFSESCSENPQKKKKNLHNMLVCERHIGALHLWSQSSCSARMLCVPRHEDIAAGISNTEGVCSCEYSYAVLQDSESETACELTASTYIGAIYMFVLCFLSLVALVWLVKWLLKAHSHGILRRDPVGTSGLFCVACLFMFSVSRTFRAVSLLVYDNDAFEAVESIRYVTTAVLECILIASLAHLAYSLRITCIRTMSLSLSTRDDRKRSVAVVSSLATMSLLEVILDEFGMPMLASALTGVYATLCLGMFYFTRKTCCELILSHKNMSNQLHKTMGIIRATTERMVWALCLTTIGGIYFAIIVPVGENLHSKSVTTHAAAVGMCLYGTGVLVAIFVHAHMVVSLFQDRLANLTSAHVSEIATIDSTKQGPVEWKTPIAPEFRFREEHTGNNQQMSTEDDFSLS
jgi:hypothetical protein